MHKYSKISKYKYKNILECFCAGMTAKETSERLHLHRNTVERHFRSFRKRIFHNIGIDDNSIHERMLDKYYYPLLDIFCINGKIEVKHAINPDNVSHNMFVATGKFNYNCALHYDDHVFYEPKNKRFLLNNYNLNFKSYAQKNDIINEFWEVSKKRLLKFQGLRKEKFFLHMKESEFRFNHRKDLYKIMSELVNETKNT